MSDLTTIVVSRVLRGGDWRTQQSNTSADLEAQLRTLAEQRGLVVEHISDTAVQTGEYEAWARLTRTATAHPPHE